MQKLDDSQKLPPKIETTYQLLADRQDAIPLIANWYFGEWGRHQTDNSVEAAIERIKTKLNRDKPPIHILAVQNDKVVGVAQLKIREMPEYPDKEFWLGSVYVPPEARGQGIAYGLCMQASEIASSIGIKELYLSTENLDGGIYSKAGWLPYERTVSRGDQVLVMVKSLGV